MISSLISSVRKRNHPVVQAPVGGGPTHYVSASGSATWAAAVNSGTPCSAATAMANAVAGNVVQFATGRYTLVGSGSRTTPALHPTYSGTSGNPIVFQTDGGVVDFEYSSGTGPVIGSLNEDYITWTGFTINEDLCPMATGDSGVVTFWGASHCSVTYCNISNTSYNFDGGVLHSGIRLEGGDIGTYIGYNTITGYRSTSDVMAGNSAAILVLSSGETTIERNDFINCNCGVTIKDNQRGGFSNFGKWLIHHNRFETISGSGIGLSQLGNTDVAESIDIYQNLFIDTALGIHIRPIGSDEDGQNIASYVRVVNNTFVGITEAGFFTDDPFGTYSLGHLVQNNIIACADDGAIYGPFGYSLGNGDSLTTLKDNLSSTYFVSEHNCIYNANNDIRFNWESGTIENMTLATWKTTLLGGEYHDVATGNGGASITSDPLFTNSGTGDYTLQAGSPARNLGVDIFNIQGSGTSASIHCGCFITGSEVIGVS